MDFTKLTSDELNSFFRMYSVTPTGNPYEYATTLFNQIGPQGPFPVEVIDLYIATQLKGKVQVPLNYNIDVFDSNTFLQIAQMFSLPSTDTPENRTRAKRILRILRALQSPVTPSIQITPIVFSGMNQQGDIGWMTRQPQYQNVLFLFTGTQEQLATGSYLPNSIGIPVGTHGHGYNDLQQARPYIDAAFEQIRQALNTRNFRQVMYPALNNGSLSTPILSPSEDVKQYIMNKIQRLTE